MVPADNGRMRFINSAGELVADDRVRDHFTSSPVGADDKIYWCSERGRTYVIDAARLAGDQPSVRVLAVNQLGAPCLASPAIAHGCLFIRTSEALYCIAGQGASIESQPAPSLPGTLAGLKARYEEHRAEWQNEPEARIRLETLEAIAQLDDPQVIPFLFETVQKEPHWDICEEAVKSLGRKGRPAVDSLIVLVKDSRPFIRTSAIEHLGRLKATKAIPAVLAATRDKEPLVRSASLRALGEIGGQPTPQLANIINALIAASAHLEEEAAVVRQSALDGLAALAGKVGARREEVIRALVTATSDRNPRLAARAKEILDDVYRATAAEIKMARKAEGGR
jgi:hypothetical protein